MCESGESTRSMHRAMTAETIGEWREIRVIFRMQFTYRIVGR